MKLFVLLFFTLFFHKSYAHFELSDVYGFHEGLPHEINDENFSVADGHLLLNSFFLKNIYFYGLESSATSKFVQNIFYSADQVSLAPSQSLSSIVPQLTTANIGYILGVTREFSTEIDHFLQLKNKDREGISNQKLKANFDLLLDKMQLVLTCQERLNGDKLKLLKKLDRSLQQCQGHIGAQEGLLDSLDIFMEKYQSFKRNYEAIEGCLPSGSYEKSKVKEFLKLYLEALLENRDHVDRKFADFDYPYFSHLPEKILLSLFIKKAQQSTIRSRDELTTLLQNQWRNSEIQWNLRPFQSERERIATLGEWIPTDAYFQHLFNYQDTTLIPPLGTYKTTQYNHNGKIIYFPNCGETSILNFLNTIFRSQDPAQLKVSPDIYQGKIHWHPSLLHYFSTPRSYTSEPTLTDYNDFNQVVSDIPHVDYLKPNDGLKVCEMNAGIDNVLKIMGHFMNEDFSEQTIDRKERLNTLFNRLSRPGFQLDWWVKKDFSKDDPDGKTLANKKNTNIELMITINGKEELRWQFNSGHFLLQKYQNEQKSEFKETKVGQTLMKEEERWRPLLKSELDEIGWENFYFIDLQNNELKKHYLQWAMNTPPIPLNVIPQLKKMLLSLPVDDPGSDLLRYVFLKTDLFPIQEKDPEFMLALEKKLNWFGPEIQGPSKDLKLPPIKKAKLEAFLKSLVYENNDFFVNYPRDIITTILNEQNYFGELNIDFNLLTEKIIYSAYRGDIPLEKLKELLNYLMQNENQWRKGFNFYSVFNPQKTFNSAVRSGQRDMVKYFIDLKGADGNFVLQKDFFNYYENFLIKAMEKLSTDSKEMLTILLEARDKNGQRRFANKLQITEALIFAIRNYKLEHANILAAIKDSQGNSDYYKYRITHKDDPEMFTQFLKRISKETPYLFEFYLQLKEAEGRFFFDMKEDIIDDFIHRHLFNHTEVSNNTFEKLLEAKDDDGHFRVTQRSFMKAFMTAREFLERNPGDLIAQKNFHLLNQYSREGRYLPPRSSFMQGLINWMRP